MPAVGSIDNIDLSAMRCRPTFLSERVERLTRDGVDGAVFRTLGKQGDRFDLICQADTESDAAAITLEQDFVALAGTAVELVDPFERTFSNVVVAGPVMTRITQAPVVAGGVSTTPTHIVHAVIPCELTEEFTP